jgi:acetyl/propionyl-CoA carboxylase alpha subunit
VTESYLNSRAILAAAVEQGADAIHPGYGLLSENAVFAQQVIDSGLTWIGPSPQTISLMGDKVAARETARRCELPLIPGSDGAVESAEEAAQVAEKIGYPLLVKASAGGGGIGMEIAKNPEKLAKTLAKCRDRASRAFGDDAVYLEKLLVNPRHIEIQLLFDSHGNGVSLFERECSIQRRHQKIVEEAPSPLCQARPELRERMSRAALQLGHAVGYVGVGTVEFLVAPTGEFYFMEMNTRLQVEHTVTEMVTDVDLVAQQIHVANGGRLDIEPSFSGHAIECRIYAEDPGKKFFPSPGRVDNLQWPSGDGVRVDSGIHSGFEVTPFYDPLLAKLIVKAANREQCIRQLTVALDNTVIDGLTTNLSFHKWLVGDEAFQQGHLSTNFVSERFNH